MQQQQQVHQDQLQQQQQQMATQYQAQQEHLQQQQQHAQRVFDVTAEALQAMKKHTEGMSASPSAGTTVTSRFSDASKVIRMPDPFGSAESDTDLSKWNEFNMSFRAWITYAETSFETDLNAAEAKGDVVFEFATLTDTQKQRSNQLYSILTGLLKHRPLIVLRGVSERNGLEVWRQLSQIYTPRNKSRSLAILTTLMQYPPFTKDKTLREQVATLDRLAQEYPRVAGKEPSDDILLGTLMRMLPSQIRAHLQVQLKEDSTYNDLRSKVLAYEIVSSTWSSQRVSIELGLNTTSASSSWRWTGSRVTSKARARASMVGGSQVVRKAMCTKARVKIAKARAKVIRKARATEVGLTARLERVARAAGKVSAMMPRPKERERRVLRVFPFTCVLWLRVALRCHALPILSDWLSCMSHASFSSTCSCCKTLGASSTSSGTAFLHSNFRLG